MNPEDPREILKHILTIIDYQEDKEKFINNFLDTCYHKALVALSKTLPEQERNTLIQRLSVETNEEKVKKIIEPYVAMPEYAMFVSKISQETLLEVLQPFQKVLTEEQKKMLNNYISQFTKEHS